MEVAKGYISNDYNNLDLSNQKSADWKVAIKIFQTRIELRYLEPIRLLIAHEKDLPARDQNYGFTIMAIICLLIETLYSFRKGITDNSGRGKAKAAFVSFLTESQSFKKFFTEDTAAIFCDHFRNGILHQAETKSKSRIRAIGPAVRIIGDSIAVNRTIIFELLEKEIRDFISELEDPDNVELHQSFKKKMDFICSR
ncbi:hypothetical protein [Algoriphagus sp. PAP.12]|uniref:hypothetical protein n=1 Tax=Algoriphagus sp. PAP.12 TaxID=2996678 RepID=UPI00227B2BDA|nr:hypothetical protein [Algoriphagus sp. PAP.12]